MVYIVDDDELVLWLYQRILHADGRSLKLFRSARAFLQGYAPRPCECLICDLRMPGMDGIELMRELAEVGMELPTILVSGQAEVRAVVEAMKLGAFDFLEKPVDCAQLVRAVMAALACSPARHAERLALAENRQRLATLTPRERQIAKRIVEGQSSRTVAQALGISVRTVENHRARLTEKLEVDSLAGLVRMFAGDSPASPATD
ncbi:response regulator transcription factor [Cupriavidus numazuensis]|uniref:Transcriptional regulatory protein FixJ n=1 Tax=Cupriavidus numazuensis TaxID=221992 RepID=A0ABM8TTR2_9BURK|nr:response regulator [Cupriavidus numazuensis]CAG2159839.1 Transcriptional regulatory protein FixJ [Cupriavidus numazuensis]